MNNFPKIDVIYTIPGLKGYSLKSYVEEIFPEIPVKELKTPPRIFSDFGQENCMDYLKIPKDNENKLIYASSQGTATILNLLKFIKPEDYNIKALILEAPMISANSAISNFFPYYNSYLWLPYLTRIIFPFYSISGLQVIKDLNKLPKIPMIIIHSEDDKTIPIKDSLTLRYRLKELGNDKVRFIQQKGNKHAFLLRSWYDKDLVRRMVNNEVMSIELKHIDSIKEHYDLLLKRESNYRIITAGIGIVFFLMIVFVMILINFF